MAKFEEFASEQDCLDGNAIADGDASLAFPMYGGDANAGNLIHDVCVDKSPDSRTIHCNEGNFQPDFRAKIESFTGDAACSLGSSDPNYHSTVIDITGGCKLGIMPDGNTEFWYKASPAKCFKFIYEFATEADCSNNKNPLEGTDQTFPFLIGASNDENTFDKRCNIHKARSHRIVCTGDALKPDEKTIIETYSASDCNIKD